MANFDSGSSNVIYTQILTSQSSPTIEDEESRPATPKQKFAINFNVSISCPFNIPSTLQEIAMRILGNLNYFQLYYVIFVWVVLLITLIPRRKHALFFFLLSTNFGVMYLLLLKAFPSSEILHKWIDKWLVLASLTIGTGIIIIVTEAGLHLLFTLVGTIPVILVHAILQPNEGLFVTEATDVAVENTVDAIV